MTMQFFLYLAALFAILAVVGWYCRRWGFDDGRNEGYADGFAEGAASVRPGLVGGPGPVPR